MTPTATTYEHIQLDPNGVPLADGRGRIVVRGGVMRGANIEEWVEKSGEITAEEQGGDPRFIGLEG